MDNSSRKVDIESLDGHDDIKSGLVHVLNAVKPDHNFLNPNQIYPITERRIEYSYNTSRGPYYASCGPRRNTTSPVYFSADKKKFESSKPERILSIYVHEITHLEVGKHSDKEHGGHPPRFWREYAFNAHKALDNWQYLEDNLKSRLSKESFIGYIVNKEINRCNIDRRYQDVPTLQHQMARWFENTLKD